MRSIVESSGRARVRAGLIASLFLAGGALICTSPSSAEPQTIVPPAGGADGRLEARQEARLCLGGAIPASSTDIPSALLDRRQDLRAARLRTETAAHQVELARVAEARPAAATVLGLTSQGLNNMVHTGSDVGQASLGIWAPPAEHHAPTPLQTARAELQAAAVAYAMTLQQAHRDVAAAAAEVRASDARAAQGAANLADAQAAREALLRGRAAGESATLEADLLRSQREVAIRDTRLTALRARRDAARMALAGALGCADQR